MCELFGLSSNQPVSPGELLCRFGARGGAGALRVYRAGRQIAHIITHPRTGPVMPNSGLPASLKSGASP